MVLRFSNGGARTGGKRRTKTRLTTDAHWGAARIAPPQLRRCWRAGGGASNGRHSAQSRPCGKADASSLAGLGTQCVEPVALHSASQPAGGVALANGAATLVSSTHSQAASTQRVSGPAAFCG